MPRRAVQRAPAATRVEYERHQCANGVRVVACHLRETRAVSARVFLGGGSRGEPEEVAGVAHFLEHAVFKGTARWPSSRALGLATERVGGAADAFTDKDHSGFIVHGPADYLGEFLDVLSDLVQTPLLDPEEVERERGVILEELRAYQDDSEDVAKTTLERMVWPKHPLGREILGTRGSIRRLTRADLDAYRAAWFTPRNAVVAVAGPRSTEDMFAEVKRAFAGWEGEAPPTWRPAPQTPPGPRVQIQSRRAEQVRFRLGFVVPSRRSKHRHALEVLATTLAGPATSRLELRLREELALVYDVSASLELYDDTGLLSFAAGVNTDRLVQALRAMLGEIVDVRRGLSGEELDRVKDYLAGRWLCAEGTDFHASFAGRDEQIFGAPTTVDEEIGRLRAVSAHELSEIATQVLRPENAYLSVCGPFRHTQTLMRMLSDL